jgi:UDP-GlcNAc3NAcA epimerase
MYDATLFYNEYNAQRETLVDQLGLGKKSYNLATIHRAENTDCQNRLKNICEALIELSKFTRVVLPLHPRTRAVLRPLKLLETMEQHLMLLEPVGYLDMLALEQNANHIITDSGGVQKEAYFNQVPCITLRDETEWVELLQSGWNQLCSPQNPFSLMAYVETDKVKTFTSQKKLYGDGHAAEKIVQVMCG